MNGDQTLNAGRAMAGAGALGGGRIAPRYLVTLVLFALFLGAYLQIETSLPPAAQWALIVGGAPLEFAGFQFYYAVLPRAVLAILVGAAMGLVGSLLQQLTQNRLLSPMTMGASSGAWLALVCVSVWLPALRAEFGAWFAMAGAGLAVALVLAIVGRRGIGGLPVVLAGMAVNILFGAIAAAIVLINESYAQNIFLWSAGDLTQTDWHWVMWLAPKLSIGLLILAFAGRPLTLLRLGQAGAEARGLSLLPVMLVLLIIALWLVASAVTAVGIIAFIGLLTPNIARSLGARGASDELFYSLLLGAMLLLTTDAIAVLASRWTVNLIPSGTTAALIGAPALIWFTRRQLMAADQTALQFPPGAQRVRRVVWLASGATLLLVTGLALTAAPTGVGPDLAATGPNWVLAWPSDLVFSLRWPRIVTAIAAGAGMAIAGVVLQRLIRNPLASPDILGLTAGATLAMVLTTVIVGGSIHEIGPLVAFAGSMAVLGILLLLGRRHNYAPGIMVLVGIALAALMDALTSFVLARGGNDIYSILGWLQGSTYRVSARQSLLLLGSIAVLLGLCVATSRWLTLISAGDHVALARGLSARKARLALLVFVALLCAVVTSIMGPVAFVGLLAPHLAAILGARKALPQLILATLVGMALMVLSDWLGRTLAYPTQLPAATIASILGGSYFIFLLARRRPT